MLSAFLRLVLISIVVIIIVVFSLSFVRWMGTQQSFEAPHHIWLDKPSWTVLAPNPSELCPLAKIKEGAFLYIELRVTDGRWIVPCSEPVELMDYLTQQSHPDFIFAIRQAPDNVTLDKLVATLTPLDSKKHFAIHASAQQVARYLRKQSPQWLFAADSGSLLRLHLFSSLGLETAFEFWPDFVIASAIAQEDSQISPREAEELHRRKKRLIWDDRSGQPEESLKIDGVVTNRHD